MNTYKVIIRWSDSYSEEITVKADYIEYTNDSALRFYTSTFDTVALFAKGFWVSVVKVS